MLTICGCIDHNLVFISFIGVVNAWGGGITFDDLPNKYFPVVVIPTSGLSDVSDRAEAAPRLEMGIFVIVRPETVSATAIKIRERQSQDPRINTLTSSSQVLFKICVTFHSLVLTFNWTHFPIDYRHQRFWLQRAGTIAILVILART